VKSTHSIHLDPTNLQLLHILAQKPTNVATKKYAVRYIESMGSLNYTKQVMGALVDQAKDMADGIDQGCGKSKGIHVLGQVRSEINLLKV
jgi:geranylgeranyl diphosphate synthase type 3